MGRIMLPYVDKTTAKGRIYFWYRRGGKRICRLPDDPASTEFASAYQSVHASFSKNNDNEFSAPGSVAALIKSFKVSAEFSEYKPRVKKLHEGNFNLLQSKIGNLPAENITRRVFLEWRDLLKETPAKANNFIISASKLWSFGVERGIVTANPAAKIRKLKTGEYRPWKENEIDAFLAVAAPDMKLAMSLALYTGQRLGDIVKMRWNQITNNGIDVTQQKTGETIWIPLHRELSKILSIAPRTSVMILTSTCGRPYKTDHLKHKFKTTCRMAGIPDECVFHGLRKTAAVLLAESGCSTEQIKSITGHRTDEMVSHYTKGANQKTLAKAAMARLEFGTPHVTH